jgi:hypothetical protein
VVQNGVTDAAAVETRLTAGNGGTFDADLVFFDPSTSSAPPHDAVRDVLSYLVVQNGVTDAAAVETRLTAAYGGTFDADLVFFDPSSRERVTYWKYRLVYILRCIAGGVPLGMGCAQMPHFHK